MNEFTMTEISNYYAEYLTEHGYCDSKAEAKRLFKSALLFNVVREAIAEQVEFLKENPED